MAASVQHGTVGRRIGVIGDVHAADDLLVAALALFERLGCDTLLCTGDLVDGPGNVDVCCELLQEAGVITVRGNHDRWCVADKVRKVPHAHRFQALSRNARDYLEALPETAEVATPAGSLLLCHGVGSDDLAKVWPGSERMPPERSTLLDGIIEAGDHALVVNGHMHYRVLIDFPGLVLMNAGTLLARNRPGVSIVSFPDIGRSSTDGSSDAVVEAYERNDQGGFHLVHRVKLKDASRHQWQNTQAFDSSRLPVRLY